MENKLSASEAVYGFAGWLTTRNKKIVASASDDASVWAEAVDAFCKANHLDDPRDNWQQNLTHPPGSQGTPYR